MTMAVRPSVTRARELDGRLGLVVDRRGCLVEHEHGRIPQDGPGDGQPLALASRELLAPLAHEGVAAVRQAEDELMGLGRRAAASMSASLASGRP